MPDQTDTSVYKTLGANNNQMTPLSILQLLGTANVLKLQQQNIDANTGVANSFKNNVNPDGTFNLPGLNQAIATSAGIRAPEVANQVQSYATSLNTLRQQQQGIVQDRVASVLANGGSMADLDKEITQGAQDNPSIPAEMWTQRRDQARAIADNPKALQKWGINQRITSPTFDATKLTGGPPSTNPNTPNAPTAIPQGIALQQAAQNGGMVTAPAPGVTEAASAAGQASGTAAAGAIGAAGNYKSSITPLTKIVHLLDTVGPTGQGIGTETTNSIKNIGVGLGLLKADTTLPVEELKKYYTQNVLRNADIGSTDKMVSAFHGNPNIDLNTASASDLAKTDLALRRLTQAQSLEGLKVPKDKFQEWSAQFNNSQDPVAYGFDLMSPSNQRKYLSELKPGSVEDQRFRNSLTTAHKWQLLEKPNAGQ
jgi:hypothetical protein